MSSEGITWTLGRWGSRWQTQEGESGVSFLHLEASLECHSEKHLVPFLWGGRQLETSECGSVGKLTTAPARGPRAPPFSGPPCVHADPSHPLSPRASAYMHNFTTSPGRAVPAASHAVVTGEYSVSHTLCIMFASFHRTNTATARASICSPARIFNYFSHPWRHVEGATLGTWTRVPPPPPSHDSFQHCQPWSLMLFVHYGRLFKLLIPELTFLQEAMTNDISRRPWSQDRILSDLEKLQTQSFFRWLEHDRINKFPLRRKTR